MIIDEAIRILGEIDKAQPTVDLHHWREAVKLGIEALRYVKATRTPGQWPRSELLPGETT